MIVAARQAAGSFATHFTIVYRTRTPVNRAAAHDSFMACAAIDPIRRKARAAGHSPRVYRIILARRAQMDKRLFTGLAVAGTQAMATPEVRERLVSAGGEAGFLAGGEFAAFMSEEGVRWTRFVEAAKKNAR
jgi:hypothetical protein